MADYDIGEAFKAIEDELMASMIRNFERHKAEEINEGYRWSAWQIEQLKELERYRVNNKKKFSDKFKKINSGIDDMLRMAKADGEMKQEAAILSAIKRGFKARKASKGATAEFFRVNERKLNALIKATQNDMEKAETAILRMANDRYRKVIFNAQVYANTGAGTYEKAVDMATKDFVNAGYNCIEYANGARHTLSDYADMAIRTASKRAYLQGEGQMRQKWGISTVIMNKRGNPCPKCLPFVGKVLIDDVWSGGKQSDGPYMLMSTAIANGLYHPRCKDSHTTYFPGISSKGAAYTDKEKEQVRKDYEAEQKKSFGQRQAERFGRLARYSLDSENVQRYAAKEKEWNTIGGRRQEGIENPVINSKIKEEELKSIYDYMSFDSYILNEKLRNNVALSAREQSTIDKLCEILDKMPNYKGNLQRSLYFNDEQELKEFLKDYVVGRTIKYKEFLSTTKGEMYNPEGQVQIFIQNAEKGKDISMINTKEQEVLYKKDSEFEILNMVVNDGIYYILLGEVK